MVSRVGGPGSWNALCDVCGFKYKANELRKRWDGLMVCEWDWESRHPQDFLKVPPDQPPLPFTRSDNDGTDVGSTLNCDGISEVEIPQHIEYTRTILKGITHAPMAYIDDTYTVTVSCSWTIMG